MKPSSIKAIAFCGIAVLLALEVVFFLVDLSPTGIKLSSPQSGKSYPRTVPVEGNAWIKDASSEFVISVVAEGASGDRVETSAPRDTVVYGDEVAFALNSFRTQLKLTSDGYWRVRAALIDSSGVVVEEIQSTIKIHSSAPERAFSGFTIGHVLPALIIIFACLGIGVLFSQPQTDQLKRKIEAGIALALWINEVVYHLYWYFTGGWTVAAGLLIQMCGLSILMLIFVFFLDDGRPKDLLFELIFFWGIGGALQAIIAPDIGARGFPGYKYFSFFLSHGLIMVGASYIVAAKGYRPTLKSVIRVFIITNVLVIGSYWFNILLEKVPPFQRGNYFVTGYPPPTGSVVDLFAKMFGPSPRYVIGLELMGLAVFLLLWLPFALTAKNRKVSASGSSEQL